MGSKADWWPMADGPYPLIDGYEDGFIEERCWVPVRAVDGPRMAAIEAFLAVTLDAEVLPTLAADGLCLRLVEGTTWQRPEGTPDGYGGFYVATDDPCDAHDEGECQYCLGTGKIVVRYESCPWRACEPTDDDAVEFYALEVVEAGGE